MVLTYLHFGILKFPLGRTSFMTVHNPLKWIVRLWRRFFCIFIKGVQRSSGKRRRIFFTMDHERWTLDLEKENLNGEHVHTPSNTGLINPIFRQTQIQKHSLGRSRVHGLLVGIRVALDHGPKQNPLFRSESSI